MAAELRKEFPGSEVSLTPSRGGRFEVMLDGKPIFEKSKAGRHAVPGEVVMLAKQRQGS